MKPENNGPFPYTRQQPPRDPFLEAIARNPHPLIMVMVGLVGMPLLLWLSAPDSPGAPSSPLPSPEIQIPSPSPGATPSLDLRPAQADASPPLSGAPDGATLTAVVPADDTPLQDALPLDTVPVSDVSVNELLPVQDVPVAPSPAENARPSIALIIDDIGYSAPLGERAIALPGAVTYAVLPHTPHGAELAELGFSRHKEIMLHAPMSNQANMALGPGALTSALSKEEFVSTLNAAIDAIPHVSGINNHMGSALTEQEAPMRWVMEIMAERGLFFVDSKTTANSVAGAIASETNIPTVTRNVFLDNVQSHEDIDREFKRLLEMAKERGVAVGIGHPYPETLLYLETALPLLAEEGIDLISASQMIARQAALRDAL